MEAPVGKILGRYEIVAEQGRGAMGAVYKARDPKIDRFVAIKTILLHQIEAEEQREFRARFFVEAQAAGRLLHPGIVAVFDVGEDPETSDPYIVMEYIEGQTLQDLLSENGKKLPLNDALRITLEIAEALDYAHAQGVVHRDIKPANILITKEGQAKIGDFGIAQLDLTHMTVPGRVIGTPAYMSPEQLEGRQVDGRSDLFSLGAILYSAVTGFSPFQGNNATAVCFQVANRDPLEATALDPELPAELDTVIARALAKDPAARYQRGLEFAQDVRKLRDAAVGCWQGQTLVFGIRRPQKIPGRHDKNYSDECKTGAGCKTRTGRDTRASRGTCVCRKACIRSEARIRAHATALAAEVPKFVGEVLLAPDPGGSGGLDLSGCAYPELFFVAATADVGAQACKRGRKCESTEGNRQHAGKGKCGATGN